MMDSMVPGNVQLLYERMHDAMLPLLKDHVVSIAALYNGEMQQHATGILVQFSDHYFLITAAHAIQDYVKGKEVCPDIQLFIDNGNNNNLVPLYGNYYATERVRDQERSRMCLEGERDDLWDIGLWELHRQTIDRLTAKKFLNRRSISITDDVTSGVFFLAGPPCSWAKADTMCQSITQKWFRYITHPYPEKDRLANFHERFHVALCLGDDQQSPAELKGISGCPIWKLADLPIPEDWDVNQVRVVAIQTCVYRKRPRAICGTKWQYVLPILVKMHPEIREAFKLWLPGRE